MPKGGILTMMEMWMLWIWHHLRTTTAIEIRKGKGVAKIGQKSKRLTAFRTV